MLVKVGRNEVVEFSDDTLTLRLIIVVVCGMPGSNITKGLWIGLAKVRRVDP